MDSLAHVIVKALGGITQVAADTGIAAQTVSDWLNKGTPEIPPWRRPLVLDAARRRNIELPPTAVEYLASTTRPPRQRAAA